MGQAKQRGSREQRIARAVAAKQEQDRLDRWLYQRRPSPKLRYTSKQIALSILFSGVSGIFTFNEI